MELSPPAVSRSEASLRRNLCAQADQPISDEIGGWGNGTGCGQEWRRAGCGNEDQCDSRLRRAFDLNIATFAEHAAVAGISRLFRSEATVPVHRKKNIKIEAKPSAKSRAVCAPRLEGRAFASRIHAETKNGDHAFSLGADPAQSPVAQFGSTSMASGWA